MAWAIAGVAGTVPAQDVARTEDEATDQQAAPARQRFSYDLTYAGFDKTTTGDHEEWRATGGFVFRVPHLGLEVRGRTAVLLTDIDAREFMNRRSGGLPRRGVAPPEPRRKLGSDQMVARIERTMRTFGQDTPIQTSGNIAGALDVLRFLYFEGGITVLRGGLEVVRCSRLWMAPLEDRVVAEEVELRYAGESGGEAMTVTIRGPRLQKSGIRWTGRDLTVTTCPAAEPQVAFAIGEAEIIERATELEIFGRDLALQLSSVNVLPLPDAHFFTGSQSQFPIKRMSGTYSRREGVRAEVVLGLPWNTTGGAIHEFLTGRPASEFRGDWELGLGYWETRGTPVNPRLMYSVPGLYSGRTEAYYMDDRGPNIREIQRNIDGSLIATESRGLIRSENRFQIGESTHLDLQAFSATDAAVLSEFFAVDYRENERPETSAFLYHQTDNHIITFGTRSTLDDFSYRSDRGLAPRFVEELPVVTWNWLAQPIGETPWETPIILDAATELGQRRSNFDDRFGSRVSDRTFRADQDIEISAPFALGPINVRPFVATRGTFYDNTIAGDNESRVALTAGIEAGTRLSRDFSWVGSDGPTSIRHVIAPRVFLIDRFHVDDNASELFQFDGTDALAEQTLVRFELRNLLQKNQPDGTTASRDFLLLDLAQDFWPDASRDNGGDELGLFYYDLIYRPDPGWTPLDTLTLALYGDHDWDDGRRTLDTELQFGRIAGLTWTLEYRTDAMVDGAVGLSAMTRAFDRWDLVAGSLYDLDRDDWLTYSFGIRRNDLDWSIALTANYDPFQDQTTVRFEFVPTLPGFARSRNQRFGGSHLHDANFATQY